MWAAGAAVLRGGCCGAGAAGRVQQDLVVVEELAERVGLVVEEGLLLRRQLGAVRVEQVLEARRTCGAMVRRKYGTPKAGTRTAYVQYVGPRGQAALCLWHVQYEDPGAYVSA